MKRRPSPAPGRVTERMMTTSSMTTVSYTHLDVYKRQTIVCVGAGLKNESLPKYRELAALLGGKLACTRRCV